MRDEGAASVAAHGMGFEVVKDRWHRVSMDCLQRIA